MPDKCAWCGEDLESDKVHHEHGNETVHSKDCKREFLNSRGLIEKIKQAVKKVKESKAAKKGQKVE